jgi:ATP-dependent Lhr-like helicase
MALEARLRAQGEEGAEAIWSDDGIVVRLPDRDRPPTAEALLPEAGEIEDLVLRELGQSSLFAARFREAAGRALLLPRRRPGQRTPLWMQRKRASDLLQVASRYASFPIILEAYRECLQDVFDLPGLVDLARRVERREVRLVTVDTQTPSPFAASLLFGYVANYLYDGDAPLAERRAQALSVDQAQLRELLGEAELRELIDRRSLAELETQLQAQEPPHQARSPDRLHDLLLRLGDLTLGEIAARLEPPSGTAEAAASAWTSALQAERRIIAVTVAGEERFAAVEDAARLRDALGVALPRGLPQVLLAEAPHALRELVARYARTHGPFRAADVARRYGTGEAPVEATLAELLAAERVVEGEFRPGGAGREWCASEVLATLRRRSLARLRKQVEPADPSALARLALDWQGVPGTAARRGPEALLEVVEQLQGTLLPASVLERDVLPARLPDYRPSDLDALCAAGEVVWMGCGPLGERDGRLSLFLPEDVPLLFTPPAERPSGEIHDRLREHLARRGASFFPELAEAAQASLPRSVLDALWDLVWAGEVTNDTPGALRAFLSGGGSKADRRPRFRTFRSRRHTPASAVGRWSRVQAPRKPPAPTERALALAEQLLARHGVLTRDAIAAEDVPGAFGALYPVLRSLEESGRVRRGYFVAGLGGSQFAHAGALDRLRSLREPDPEAPQGAVVAATDPANIYGAAVPWPRTTATRLMRAAGAHVALVDGRLVAFLGKGERDIATFLPADEPPRSNVARALASALARWAVLTGRTVLGWSAADGQALTASPLAPFLVEAGFQRSGPGYRLPAARDDAALLAEPAGVAGREDA